MSRDNITSLQIPASRAKPWAANGLPHASACCLVGGFLLSGAVAQQTSPNLKFHAFVFQHPSMNFDDTQHHAYRNRNLDSPSFYPGPSLTTPQADSPEILPREFPVYRMEHSSEYGAEINDEMQAGSLNKNFCSSKRIALKKSTI